jgi:hypothetical protein
MTTPIPPNPWLTLGGIPSPRGADVPYSPVVAASAPSTNAAPDRSSSLPSGVIDPSVTADYAGAAAVQGYPCCPDCGVREPCDEFCPNFSSCGAQGAHQSLALAGDVRETQRPEMDVGAAPDPHEATFTLDDAAFMSDIEPVPAFLTCNNGYGAGEQTVGQSSERGHCFNRPALNADGLFSAGPATVADEIEELLELARAQDWPIPPRRMRA